MDLTQYEVNIELPEPLMSRIREEASDAKTYSISGYPGSSVNSKEILLKSLRGFSNGPQKAKSVSSEIIASLESLINFGIEKASILRCEPNFVITPHVDAESKASRKSCLTWVIFPENIELCAPTLFYDENDTVIASHKYTRNAFILDTRLRHGMINNGQVRTLLQLTYDLEPTELKERLR